MVICLASHSSTCNGRPATLLSSHPANQHSVAVIVFIASVVGRHRSPPLSWLLVPLQDLLVQVVQAVHNIRRGRYHLEEPHLLFIARNRQGNEQNDCHIGHFVRNGSLTPVFCVRNQRPPSTPGKNALGTSETKTAWKQSSRNHLQKGMNRPQNKPERVRNKPAIDVYF